MNKYINHFPFYETFPFFAWSVAERHAKMQHQKT